MSKDPNLTGEGIVLTIERTKDDASVDFHFKSLGRGSGIPLTWASTDEPIPESAGQYERMVRCCWQAMCANDIKKYVRKEGADD